MNRDEIMEVIRSLSTSQGFYSRLYHSLRELKESDPDSYDMYMTHLEEQNFGDSIDVVLYLEG